MSQFLPSDFGPPSTTIFIPFYSLISNITQAQQAIVTFTADHSFTLFEWISFRIPPTNGMIQLNNQKALIVALSPTTVTIDLDTLQFFPFISMTDPQYPCMAVPAGSGIIEGEAATTLEDAFDNLPLV